MLVCRLCGNTEVLIDLFSASDELELRQLRYQIVLATGVEIQEDDVVSKMVCYRCCEIAINLYQYRAKAVAYDKLLKEQYGEPYMLPVTDQDDLRRLSRQILTSNGEIAAAPIGSLPFNVKLSSLYAKNTTNHEVLELLSGVTIKSEPVEEMVWKPEPYKHKSVKDIYKKFPSIILPESIFKCDIAPTVTLDKSNVEEWAEEEFKRVQQKLSLAKIIIQKVCKNSLSDKSNVSIPTKSLTNGTLPVRKQPGPKSKTMDLLVYDEPITTVFKVKECSKPKKVDFTHEDETTVDKEIVNNKSMPRPKKQEISTFVTGKPGSKSCKSNPVLNNAKPKLAQTSASKSNPKGGSNELDIKVMNANKPLAVSNTLVGAAVLDSDDDFDFDLGTVFTDGYSDETQEDFVKAGVNHLKKEQSLRCSKRSSFLIRNNDDPGNKSIEISKPHSLRKSKKDKRSLHSAKLCSPVESSEFDEPSQKRRVANGKYETELLKNNQSTSKIKPNLVNTDIPKVDSHKNKDILAKKHKSKVLESTSSDKKPTSFVSTIKKETLNGTVNEKKLNVCVKEPTDLVVNVKKEPPEVTTSRGSSVMQETKTLTSSTPNVLIGKAQKIHMCHMCCKLFDSSKELSDHQRAHLTCQFCHYKMKNVETLKKHQKENCRMIMKH